MCSSAPPFEFLFMILGEYMSILEAKRPTEMSVSDCLLTIPDRQNMKYITDVSSYLKSRIQWDGYGRKRCLASVLNQNVHISSVRPRQVWTKLWILVQHFGRQMLLNGGPELIDMFCPLNHLFFSKHFSYFAYERDIEICLVNLPGDIRKMA